MSIFKESSGYRPFVYPWAVVEAKKHAIDMSWDVHQIDLTDDLRQYKTKDGLATKTVGHADNKETLDSLICFFTQQDVVVGEGYSKLLPHVKNNEIRNLLITHIAREVVHQRAYALAAETLGFPDSAWTKFRDVVEMQSKLNLMSKGNGDLSKPLEFAKHLVKILIGEGVGLFAAFTCLLNLKRQGIFIGFNDVNQWSLLDESHHVENNIRIVLTIVKEDLTPEEYEELKLYTLGLLEEFKEVEHKFIDLLGPQEGITKQELKGYIEYLCDLRASQLGMGKVTKQNPLEFMTWLVSGGQHDNFFEKKVTAYSHDPLGGGVDYTKYASLLQNRLIA